MRFDKNILEINKNVLFPHVDYLVFVSVRVKATSGDWVELPT